MSKKIPKISLPPKINGLSEKEVESYDEDALDREANHNEHKRRESIRDVCKWVVIVGIVLFAIATFAIAFCWLWHLLTPDKCHFLSDQQTAKLQLILISGILGNLPTFAKKYLSK